MTEKNTPIERRTIIKAAAWAAPVVAVAATAAPAFAATTPVNEPRAVVTGSVYASSTTSTRTLNYTGGAVTFDPAATTESTGDIYVSFSISGVHAASYSFNIDKAAFIAAGWTEVGSDGLNWMSPGLSSAGSITIPPASWTTSPVPAPLLPIVASVGMFVANSNVASTNLSTTVQG